ncbi:potassium-transporting ATPase subunit KdpC [Chitinibacter sp. ZOR0017]|uniref:potassium-transporting ATPase subunit KdpC n=1 Tax=Chitinibacter sp. ZOR0017 TaxID=1339254 RepID=UPI000A5C5AF4|nr:potassium-transporting ATPase subunit KdpC [Chitinibacter sp. ZOR0017]
MSQSLSQQFRPALALLLGLTIITGVVYPALTTGLAQAIWPWQANGSLLQRDGQVAGSALIGQAFSGPRYFWSRPSATATLAYNGLASGGSNLGPTNPALQQQVSERAAALRAAHPGQSAPVPLDLVTTSASGLDPHISPAAATYQLERVAAARHLPVETVARLVKQHTRSAQWGILGEPVVNVLALNLALDELPQ